MIKNYALLITLFSLHAVGQINIPIETPVPICNPGDCAILLANYPEIKQTTSYTVQSIPYNPSFPFTWDGITSHRVSANGDDFWSNVIALPFNFCFYENTYNQLVIGTNGVISFNLESAGGNCPWQYNSSIPSTTFPIKNAIYGVYQDTNTLSPPVTNPNIQNANFYILDTGINTAPNRVFVVNFNELPLFDCNNSIGLQTSQIVLYEATNVIEVNVNKRSACTNWNYGNGVIGIQNQSGTVANFPLVRNTGTWSATNESWRFSPDGVDLPGTIQWFKNNIVIPNATTNSLFVCPTQSEETYKVQLNYTQCDGTLNSVSNSLTVNIEPQIVVENPLDLYVCSNNSTEVFNINQDEIMLGNLNPNDYIITYHLNQTDAENVSNIIFLTNTFLSSNQQSIYVRIEKLNTGCYTTRFFSLIISPIPSPPTGLTNQTFVSGETLANIEVSGTNITWYDQPTEGNVLPIFTILVDGTTYYAWQTNQFNCESNRSANSNRFAVTVFSALSNDDWSLNNFKSNPNPVKNVFNLSYDKKIMNVSVFNLLGQQIIFKSVNDNQTHIDMSNLDSGTYMIKIISDSQEKLIKVIKE